MTILCFTGSHCCSVSYYNYISIWPYYIVIHYAICYSPLSVPSEDSIEIKISDTTNWLWLQKYGQ